MGHLDVWCGCGNSYGGCPPAKTFVMEFYWSEAGSRLHACFDKMILRSQ